MILSVHQPNYFPYPGFFHKVKLSDIFVVLDNVQYAKGSNRNKIITSKGWTWITVPINKTHKFSRVQKLKLITKLIGHLYIGLKFVLHIPMQNIFIFTKNISKNCIRETGKCFLN